VSDFKLEILVEALTAKLDSALAYVEQRMSSSASTTDKITKKQGNQLQENLAAGAKQAGDVLADSLRPGLEQIESDIDKTAKSVMSSVKEQASKIENMARQAGRKAGQQFMFEWTQTTKRDGQQLLFQFGEIGGEGASGASDAFRSGMQRLVIDSASIGSQSAQRFNSSFQDVFDSEMQALSDAAVEIGQTIGTNIADGVEPGIGKLAKTVAKILALVTAVEATFKLAAAAVRGMSGDAEEAQAALESLPLIGPTITAFNDFAEALHETSDAAIEARNALFALEQAQKDAAYQAQILTSNLQLQREFLSVQGVSEADILTSSFKEQNELLKAQHQERIAQIRETERAEIARIKEAKLGFQEESKALTANLARRIESIKIAEDELSIRKGILIAQKDAAELAEKEAEAAEKQAKRAERRAKKVEKIKQEFDLEQRIAALRDRIEDTSAAIVEQRKLELEFQQKIAEATAAGNKKEAERLRLVQAQLAALLKQAQEVEKQRKAEEEREARRKEEESILSPIEQEEEDLRKREEDLQVEGDPIAQRELEKQRELNDLRRKYDEQIKAAREAGNEGLARELEFRKKFALEDLKRVQAIEDEKSEREKMLADSKKMAEEAEKLAKIKAEGEEEIAKMRAEEADKAAKAKSATTSFQTAAGSFTIAAPVQVNEAKILNKIQKKSQELLEKIAENTSKPSAGVTLA